MRVFNAEDFHRVADAKVREMIPIVTRDRPVGISNAICPKLIHIFFAARSVSRSTARRFATCKGERSSRLRFGGGGGALYPKLSPFGISRHAKAAELRSASQRI